MAVREYPRTRREVASGVISILSPLFRYSASRDAYVLRIVGNRMGPVLRRRSQHGHPAVRH